MSRSDYPFRNILGIPIASLSLSVIPSLIESSISSPGKKMFFYVNTHCLNLARQDAEYKRLLQKAVNKLKKKFPKLGIVGYHHGFFDIEEEEEIIREINEKKPKLG